MKTIEEKAQAAWEDYTYPEGNLYSNVFKDAYKLGATEALAGQWKSVEDELPEYKVDVLICTDKGQVKTSCWFGKEKEAADMDSRHRYWKWWGNFHPYVLYWMPLPVPPKAVSE